MKKSKSDIVFRILSRLFILVLALSVAFPLVMTISVSLQTMNEIYSADPVIIPNKLQFENYANAMASGNWPRYFINSAIVTFFTVVISLIINSMAGFVFARIPFKFRDVLFVMILLGMMIPTQVTLIPVFTLLRNINIFGGGDSGLINTYTGLVLPFIAGSFGVFLCRQFYVSFPKELDDAAMIDGCGRFSTYVRIYLPLSGPVLASLGVLKFTGTWNEYTWPLVATSGDEMKTVQVALTGFRDEGEIYWNLLMAATLIAGLPIYVVFFFAQKHFVSGLLAGSVKA
ncbi:MAG: carbohydrate ABC transporter permease [Clostridia bacterium]|nr:carbohydrate ABC transporter permease [Clostridia bacterium]MBQ4157472.1 carbohydrate ABC transporter permease [Clostridia bacterium]